MQLRLNMATALQVQLRLSVSKADAAPSLMAFCNRGWACAPPDLADEEAGQDTGDGRDHDEQPEEGGSGQRVCEEVVDGGGPLQGQRTVADHVQEPHHCTHTQASLMAWARLICEWHNHL